MMMMQGQVLLLLCCIISSTTVTTTPSFAAAFSSSSSSNIYTPVKHNTPPPLDPLASNIYGTKLTFRIAVGNSQETPFQLSGINVEFGTQKHLSKSGSTGIHNAILLQPQPYYVNEQGQQNIELIQGGWEISWGKGSPHGHLVTSFISPKPLQRTSNGDILDAGRFFMQHRVWTKTTLESERQRRRSIQDEASKYLIDRDTKITEIIDEENTNPLSKVVSYGQAVQSMNNYRMTGLQEARFIPFYDEQVIQLNTNCIVSTRGQLFQTLTNNLLGGVGKQREIIKIGECRVDALVIEKESRNK